MSHWVCGVDCPLLHIQSIDLSVYISRKMSECEPTIAGYKINACESGALLIVNVLQCSK